MRFFFSPSFYNLSALCCQLALGWCRSSPAAGLKPELGNVKFSPELLKPSSGTEERSCADLPHMRDVSAAENTFLRNEPSKCVLKQADFCFYAVLQHGILL